MSRSRDSSQDRGPSAMGIGTKVILVLGGLTVIEYIIAVSKPPGQLPLIFLIAIVKAVLILLYFMHIRQIWNGEQP